MTQAPQPKRFIAYMRVSTTKQGHSGLGLEAQRQACIEYARSTKSLIVSEFIETESGRLTDRPRLTQALDQCRKLGATLLIAKLDRLARNVAFVSALMEGGVDFVAADAPYANRLMIHILAAFAEHEREQIAQRTRDALAAAKARGVRLGANGHRLAAMHRADAATWSERLRGPVERALSDGATTLADLSEKLNNAGWQTRDNARWSPGTTSRLVRRLNIALKRGN